jgi:hypothetical protein
MHRFRHYSCVFEHIISSVLTVESDQTNQFFLHLQKYHIGRFSYGDTLNTRADLALALQCANNRLPFSLTRLLNFGLPTKTEGAESGIQLDRSRCSPETPTGPCMGGNELNLNLAQLRDRDSTTQQLAGVDEEWTIAALPFPCCMQMYECIQRRLRIQSNYTLVRFSEAARQCRNAGAICWHQRIGSALWGSNGVRSSTTTGAKGTGLLLHIIPCGRPLPCPCCDVLDRLDGRVREKCMVCRLV